MDVKRFRKGSDLETEEKVADHEVLLNYWGIYSHLYSTLFSQSNSRRLVRNVILLIFFSVGTWSLSIKCVKKICKDPGNTGQHTDLQVKQYMYKRKGMMYQSRIPPA